MSNVPASGTESTKPSPVGGLLSETVIYQTEVRNNVRHTTDCSIDAGAV